MTPKQTGETVGIYAKDGKWVQRFSLPPFNFSCGKVWSNTVVVAKYRIAAI